MGNGKISIAVADAGPIIHLHEINCLSLLHIFEILHIQNAVWLETVGQNRVSQDDILSLGIVQHHNLIQSEIIMFIEKNNLGELQDGECECFYLCQHIGVSVILTDDMLVREKSSRLNITPVGSLGVVVRAYRLGLITLDNAKNYITDLYNISSLFVTWEIVELAIEQLEKSL